MIAIDNDSQSQYLLEHRNARGPEPPMYVCICHPITDKQIKQVLQDGAQTTAAVFRHFGHKVQCGKCIPYVRGMVDEHREQAQAGCGGNCGCCANHEAEAANDAATPDFAYGVAAE